LIELKPEDTTYVASKKSLSSCRLGLINARSVMNKSHVILDHIVDSDLDILAITETWAPAGNSDHAVLKDLCPDGFSVAHRARRSKRGGGVALIHRDTFKAKIMKELHVESFECLEAMLTTASTCVRIVVIYRPPPSQKNGLSKTLFFDEFSNFLNDHTLSTGRMIILGDFNFHWENNQNTDTIHLRQILESCSLMQHVKGPTHTSNHTLDLVIF
jgi:exonuclease III